MWGKKYSSSDCSTDLGGDSSSSAIGSNSMSAISCRGHAAGETVFGKDFPSGSRGLALIAGQGGSGGCSDHFLHGSALGVAGGGSDHLAHGSASKADPNSNLEDKMWGKRLVLLQWSYPLTTQPYVCSKDTVSASVWPGSTSTLLACFVSLQFHGDWDSYLSFGLWVDDRMMGNPDAIIHIEKWTASLSDDAGGSPAPARDPVHHEDDVSSHLGFFGERKEILVLRGVIKLFL
jgi:hypothetical protein